MVRIREDPGAVVNRIRGAKRGSGCRNDGSIGSLEVGDRRRKVEIPGETILRVDHGGFVFVSQSQVQSQPLGDLEVVVDVETPENVPMPLDGKGTDRSALVQGPDEEAGPRVAAEVEIGIEKRIGSELRFDVKRNRSGTHGNHALIAPLAADLEVMAALSAGDFVLQVVRYRILVPKAGAAQSGSSGTAANGKAGIVDRRHVLHIGGEPVGTEDTGEFGFLKLRFGNGERIEDPIVSATHVEDSAGVDGVDGVDDAGPGVTLAAVGLCSRGVGVIVLLDESLEHGEAAEQLQLVGDVPVAAVGEVPVFDSLGKARTIVVHPV